MTIYTYAGDSLIDEVRIVTNVAGGVRAYIQSKPNATYEQLDVIRNAFANYGWTGTPHTHEGRSSLELRGFKKPEELLNLLQSHGWAKDVTATTHTKDAKISRGEKWRNATLKATGLVYNVGDVAYMVYALTSHKHETAELKKIEGYAKELNEGIKAGKPLLELHAEQALLDRRVNEHNIEAAKKYADKIFKRGKAGKKTKEELVEEYQHKTFAQLLDDGKSLVEAANDNIKAGIGYAMGGSLLTFFGSKDQSPYEIKEASQKAKSFLTSNGADVSNSVSLNEASETSKQSILSRVNHFLRRYPSEILNFVYVGVGLFLASHSYKNYKINKEPSDLHDIGLGSITAASSVAGIFIKEKKRPEGAPKRKGLEGVWDWIQEKPLRATGYGFMLATAFHAHSSYTKWQEGDAVARKTVFWRIVFVASNVVAELLMAVSSKGHGHGVKTDESVEQTVLSNIAEAIAQQPAADQPALINKLSGYMAASNVLGGKADHFATELHKNVETINQNPWAHKSFTHMEAAAPAVEPVIEQKIEEKKETPRPQVSNIMRAETIERKAHSPVLA